MNIARKFTPEEAAVFLAECRAEQKSQPPAWKIRYGQTVVNRLGSLNKQTEPIPEIFYTNDDKKVDEWFWNTWVASEA